MSNALKLGGYGALMVTLAWLAPHPLVYVGVCALALAGVGLDAWRNKNR